MSDTDKRADDALNSLDALGRVPQLGGVAGRVVGVMDALMALVTGSILVAIGLVVILQILGRLLLPSAPVWTEELSRYLFIAMIASAAGLVVRRHKHISLELFHHRLGVRGACLYQLLVTVTLTVFAVIVIPYAWQFAAIGAFQTSSTLQIPMIWVFATITILLVLTALYGVIGALEAIIGITRPEPLDERRQG